jgi:hypothetical protein
MTFQKWVLGALLSPDESKTEKKNALETKRMKKRGPP